MGCEKVDTDPLPVSHAGTFKIRIVKRTNILELFSDTTLIKKYRCSFGRNPKGDKEIEGDNKTPIGNFYISSKKSESRFHRFLGISYPAIDDAERGLRQNIITKAEYDSIVMANHNKHQPPQKTKLGGDVGIHGNGRWDFILKLLPWRFDWTQGCIALNNRDIEELFNLVSVGTPVKIIE
jgi:murein L,D-transpeptidase YafK